MGADLYIGSIIDKARATWSPRFDKAVQKRNAMPREKEKSAKYKALQKEVERCYNGMHPKNGYFRDSYNCTNLTWRWDTSWSAFIDTECGEGEDTWAAISVENAKIMLAMAKHRPIPSVKGDPNFERWQNIGQDKPKRMPKREVERWDRYFEKKRKWMILFLETAIEKNEPIRASC